jgi:Tetratricopeptide repeat
LKWVGAGALASSSALALFSATQSAPSSHTRELASTAQVVRSAPVTVGVPLVPQPALPTPEVAASASVPATASAPQADLAREVAGLDAARQALIDGDAALALRLLSSLERAPRRALVPEATVLRVRALLAQGDAAQARRVAERFLAVAPSSPQASVLRRLIENNEMQPAGSRL